MSRPTVFVHVGCRKTGTSFLQKAIYSSTDALAAQGIALPLPGRGEHYQVVAALREVVDGHPVPPDSRQVIDDLARTVGVIALDRAIMTHEALAPATPAQVRTLMDALDGCEVHVVITARDLARQIPSEWQQTVKDRSVLPYAVFCREVVEGGSHAANEFWARQDVADIARRWSTDLPPERVHVVAVPPAGSPPEQLLGMFTGLIGCDPASLATPGGYNPSLGAEQAELLRRVNLALGDRLTDLRVKGGYRDVVRGTLAKGVLSHQQGAALLLPAELAGWCREQSLRQGRRDRGPGIRRRRPARAPRPRRRRARGRARCPRGHRRAGRRGSRPGPRVPGRPPAPRADAAEAGAQAQPRCRGRRGGRPGPAAADAGA